MAERSGERELDGLIEEFMAREDPPRAIETWRTRAGAAGRCGEASDDFLAFLEVMIKERNCLTIREYSELNLDLDQGECYTDRGVSGSWSHRLVIVVTDSYQYGVDWTAAQYGYEEFPMVLRRAHNGAWSRTWLVA